MKIPPITFTSTDDACNWIADLPLEIRWQIIEGLMLKSLKDTDSDTQSIQGLLNSGKVKWLLLMTKSPELLAKVAPILKG